MTQPRVRPLLPVALLSLFVLAGRYFERRSKRRAGAALRTLMELGAKDEGPVGQRMDGFYAGYFRDLDGNKLNVFCMG
mgnify:CR=1 FL=1